MHIKRLSKRDPSMIRRLQPTPNFDTVTLQLLYQKHPSNITVSS
ncbi:hypothetical protein PCAR4_250035 [Paraburkholderia caribensis]|nr:hypothetical protein PCAR4_250035 [Paraburkholderia caribensis]